MTPQLRPGTNIIDIYENESFLTTGGQEVRGPKTLKMDSVRKIIS